MAYATTFEAVVLRTVDVGDADRYCLLFTLEAGRKAARARGVRKPSSRMSGLLLPFKRVRVQVQESRAGGLVTSVAEGALSLPPTPGFVTFMRLQQAAELLLALTEDDEPLPQVFHLLEQFLAVSTDDENPLPAFMLRLLYLLGLLPLTEDDARFRRLSPASKRYLARVPLTDDILLLAIRESRTAELRAFTEKILGEILQRALPSADIVAQLRMQSS